MKWRAWFPVLLLCLVLTGSTILALFEDPNTAEQAEPDEPVGTYNASFNVPWYLDFNSVSATQAAHCRRYLVTGTAASGGTESPCQGIDRDSNFVALALSGGGSRSAALSAAVMWELDRLGIMEHVDVISAVSGGAQAAALYAVQRDPTELQAADGTDDRASPDEGNQQHAIDVFENDLTRDWIVSLLMPWNMAATMFTNYSRTDVMADTFANKYYGNGKQDPHDPGLRFRDINPRRPNMLLNAVDMSLRLDQDSTVGGTAGECFTMSYETFRYGLSSDLHNFPIAQAVMATNTVPGVHQYYSLREFGATGSDGDETYVHLADGSIRDHLALVPVNAMLRQFAEAKSLSQMRLADLTEACQFSRGSATPRGQEKTVSIGKSPGQALADRPLLPEKVLIIVVDSGIPPRGVGKENASPGGSLLNKLVPVSMVVDAIDTTLDDQRALRAIELLEVRNHLTGRKQMEVGVWRCAHEHQDSMEAIAGCLTELQNPASDEENGVLGPACCPIIGLGIHNYMKFAAEKFGPINLNALDSDKIWGADLVTLECMADNGYGRGVPNSLYSDMRTISLRLSLDASEVQTVKRAARALVDEMLVDFCDHELKRLGGIEELKCTPPPETRQGACQT